MQWVDMENIIKKERAQVQRETAKIEIRNLTSDQIAQDVIGSHSYDEYLSAGKWISLCVNVNPKSETNNCQIYKRNFDAFEKARVRI